MHEELGFNFRFTNLQAAIGLAQMERIEQTIAKKRFLGQQYTKRLERIAALQLPVEESWGRSVYWMYGVVVKDEVSMDAKYVAEKLLERGIETRPFFLGMHEQPVFKRRGLFKERRYPVSERLSRQGLYLPSGAALTEEQLAYVADELGRVLCQ